jgi:hypothetical protein
MATSSTQMRSFRARPRGHDAAVARIQAWTRRRFTLPEAAAVLVAEVDCMVPGCPPVETVVAFWTERDRRHHFKVFKRLADVVEDDLPPYWMKDALLGIEVFGCECC